MESRVPSGIAPTYAPTPTGSRRCSTTWLATRFTSTPPPGHAHATGRAGTAPATRPAVEDGVRHQHQHRARRLPPRVRAVRPRPTLSGRAGAPGYGSASVRSLSQAMGRDGCAVDWPNGDDGDTSRCLHRTGRGRDTSAAWSHRAWTWLPNLRAWTPAPCTLSHSVLPPLLTPPRYDSHAGGDDSDALITLASLFVRRRTSTPRLHRPPTRWRRTRRATDAPNYAYSAATATTIASTSTSHRHRLPARPPRRRSLTIDSPAPTS